MHIVSIHPSIHRQVGRKVLEGKRAPTSARGFTLWIFRDRKGTLDHFLYIINRSAVEKAETGRVDNQSCL